MAIVVETWMGEDLDLGIIDTEHTHQSGGVIPGTKISLTTFSVAGVSGYATTASWSPGEIAIGGQATVEVTVPGAQVGDLALASYDGISVAAATDQLMMGQPQVTAADTVRIVVTNHSAAPLTPTGNLKVLVFHVR